MKLSSCLVVLVFLWTVIPLAAKQRNLLASAQSVVVTLKGSSDKIKFPKDMFTEFYECLSKGTNIYCTAKYENFRLINEVNSKKSNGDNRNNNCNCKYYKCEHNVSRRSFKCTHQEQPSRNCSEMYQFLQIPNESDCANDCVALLKDIIQDIDYSKIKNDVKECDINCPCLTTAISTATTTQPVQTSAFPPADKSTVKPTTKKTATLSNKSTETTTTGANESTKTTTTAANKQTKSSASTPRRIRTTTEANITVAELASNSDTNQDDTSVIIGVVVPLGVIAIVAVIVIVSLWHRKRRALHKNYSEDHDYANIVKTTTSSQKAEFQHINQHMSSPYSNSVADSEGIETYTYNNVNNLEDNSQLVVNNGYDNGANKPKHDFVYSIAGSPENTSTKETQFISETRPTSHDKVDNNKAKDSVVNYSDVSKPKRNLKKTMNRPTTSNSTTTPTECSPTKDTQGNVCTSDSGDNRMQFGYSQNDKENSKNQYYSLEPEYSNSHLNSLSTNGKLAKVIPHTAHSNSLSTGPTAVVLKQETSHADPPASQGANENVEYSFARNPPEQDQYGAGHSNVYAKLHEDPSKTQNLYDRLPQPTKTGTPTYNDLVEDTEYSIAKVPDLTENTSNSSQEHEQSNVYSKLGENPIKATNIYDRFLQTTNGQGPAQQTHASRPQRTVDRLPRDGSPTDEDTYSKA